MTVLFVRTGSWEPYCSVAIGYDSLTDAHLLFD
jgi:hypothetical protein